MLGKVLMSVSSLSPKNSSICKLREKMSWITIPVKMNWTLDLQVASLTDPVNTKHYGLNEAVKFKKMNVGNAFELSFLQKCFIYSIS